MEFDFLNGHKLSIVRSGRRYPITLLDSTRKPFPISILGANFWFSWAENQKFVAKLAEKIGCSPRDVIAPLEKIGSEIQLKGKRILEPARPPKKTEPGEGEDNGKGMDTWVCSCCGRKFKMAKGESPDICPNTDCGRSGPFRALTGPYIYFNVGKFGMSFVAKRLADDILKNRHFVTHRESWIIYRYKGGRYQADGEATVRELCREKLDELAKEYYINEVVAHITETTYTYAEKFNAPLDLVNVKNGILNIKTNELLPHTPDIIFINELPIDYDPQKQCPKIMKFLAEILDAGYIPLVQEIVGYCLLRDYPLARAVMLLGGGANAKSTLLNLIAALLGAENVATPSLQDLLENRFSKGELFGKLANIHADIPSSELVSTGIFKMLTGQDLMWADVKHKKAFKFRNYAKLLYSANELPKTEDLSEAFWRRWIIIKFTRVFREGDPKTDPNILEKLTTPDELSGFLNWALEGLHRLLKQGHFTRTEAWVDVEREWIRGTDSLRAFANERVQVELGAFTTKAIFYDQLKAFCAEYEIECPTMSAVGHRLPSIIPQTGEIHPRVGGKQVKAWRDISLITDITDNLTTFWPVEKKKTKEEKKDDIQEEITQKNGNIGNQETQTTTEAVSKREEQTPTAELTVSDQHPTWLPCEFLIDHPRSPFIDPDTENTIKLGPFGRGDRRGIPSQFAHQMALKGIVKILKETEEQAPIEERREENTHKIGMGVIGGVLPKVKPEKIEEKPAIEPAPQDDEYVKSRLFSEFGMLPFKLSQVSKLFKNGAAVENAKRVIEGMRGSGELEVLPLMGGKEAFQFAWSYKPAQKPPNLEQTERVRRVYETVALVERRYEGGAPIWKVRREAESDGISRSFLDATIDRGVREGILYEPRAGFIARAVK